MDFTHPPTPIASLSPSLTSSKVDNASHPWFVGSIRLVWPYISGNGIPQITFLLADTDVLKRAEKGQVRVRIVKKLAAEVKNSGAHIGDELSLPLEDVSWVEEDEERKGGRWVGWVVEIGERGGKCKVCFLIIEEMLGKLNCGLTGTIAGQEAGRECVVCGGFEGGCGVEADITNDVCTEHSRKVHYHHRHTRGFCTVIT
jgi:hypothetical protein